MPEAVLLKKYSNRRLYNTEKSAYVTLGQVADLIKKGRQIEVIDAKTKEDVTAFILTQIILEEAKKRNALLPIPLLHLIIRHGDNILAEFFDKYLEGTLKSYLSYKSSVDDQFKKWLEMGANLSDMTQKSLKDMNPFQSVMNSFFTAPNPDEKDKNGQ